MYRPLVRSQLELFIDEFGSLLEALNTVLGRLLICGDVNIHMEDKSKKDSVKSKKDW